MLFVVLIGVLVFVGAGAALYRRRKERHSFSMPILTNRFRGNTQLGEQMVVWLKALDEDVCAAWILDLNRQDQAAFIRYVGAFCKQQGIELAWVIDRQFEDEMIQEHMDRVVIHLVQAYQLASQLQGELKTYIALVNLLNNAGKIKNRPITQSVYLQLAHQNLIPRADVNLLFSKQRNRWEHAAKAIAAASRTDRTGVNYAIHKKVLLEENPPTI